jgi:O-antigen ligase
MKKTIKARQTWGEAVSNTFLFLMIVSVIVSIGSLVIWGLAVICIGLWAISPFLPLVLIIPAAITLAFRYTPLDDLLDKIMGADGTSSSLPPM